ncbi:hypothetical protein COW36_20205 [bacterium (Candidatus Blackallbacteria) CG17_big_fil_post_rev_8_21_14_2_50_48_46]|uniref:Phytanoyl-CoA dioxygenase n=1 Tax=bacterium (Candidatus Blackallbacteria) CG17_big_fil_post_rev_8_21_14_2_50_48_46 TaxID=2014261 RepID=A0A2M7FZF5_9BACT|nr:MAG: hypothetical protein COW64_22530 [bacterium (Candidatus Blackallbacteria) CG18_big_fil_WC_8_21_14_2_50_49_26]PIW14731.1 MAG: hypothetical protein COW36_20205 [bacterium (Candidatus Blackallbacteria) CG17_big_fil_post_rev_8_21_14_2_50_48_46]PIW50833.1 MAG: hypothetical protein COW20_01020 [bacterium (Candidatus Blackallbacteria) CG13_big_fil_rev_8_21_14_2_50_49_14]
MNYPQLTFTAQDLSLPDLLQALEQAGCVRINGLFPQAVMTNLAQWSESAFAQFDYQRLTDTLDPLLKDYFALVPHMINHLPGACLHLFKGDSDFLYKLFLASPLPDILHALYRGPFLYSSIHAVIRRQTLKEPQWYTGFHQDGHFLNPDWKFLHCWSPLVSCGVDRPGLELIPAGLKAIRPLSQKPFRGEHFYDNRDLDLESEILPYFPAESFWMEPMQPGDALFYDSFCLHRTYLTSEMTQPRYNLEMRFLPAVDLPAEIAQLGFIRV